MAGNLGDYLRQKAEHLDVGRADTLVVAQSELDRLYPGQTKAIGLHQGKLRVITPSASIASDLRMRQIKLVEAVRARCADADIERLIIQIRSL